MPALLERIFPFLKRKHTRNGFQNLARLATHFGQEEGLDSSRLALWTKLTWLAAYTLIELFVKNSHPGVDWNLRPQCKRVGLHNIVTLYYWMCLYFLAMVRRTGVPGGQPENDYLALKGTTQRFPAHCVTQIEQFSTRVEIPHPQPFSETWDTDDPDKVTNDLCLAIHDLLALKPTPVVRTIGVVRFKHAARDAFLVGLSQLEESTHFVDQEGEKPK